MSPCGLYYNMRISFKKGCRLREQEHVAQGAHSYARSQRNAGQAIGALNVGVELIATAPVAKALEHLNMSRATSLLGVNPPERRSNLCAGC